MRNLIAAGVTLLVMTAAAATAAAQPGQTAPRDEERVEVVATYGLQTLAADGLGIGLMIAGGAMDNDGVSTAGAVVSGFGPAIVHIAHGNPGRAVLSATLRPGLVFLGASLGAGLASCTDGEFLCGFGEAIIGGAVGYGAAMAIDALALARTTRTERRWAPSVAPRPGGVQVGVVGTF